MVDPVHGERQSLDQRLVLFPFGVTCRVRARRQHGTELGDQCREPCDSFRGKPLHGSFGQFDELPSLAELASEAGVGVLSLGITGARVGVLAGQVTRATSGASRPRAGSVRGI
jgi:hypothetical protein